MKFKLLPAKEVIRYLNKYKETSGRSKQIKALLGLIDDGELTAYYGFKNEYGERYLVLGKDLKRWVWAGDESDWEIASSYYEDSYVNELLEVHRVNITKIKDYAK